MVDKLPQNLALSSLVWFLPVSYPLYPLNEQNFFQILECIMFFLTSRPLHAVAQGWALKLYLNSVGSSTDF